MKSVLPGFHRKRLGADYFVPCSLLLAVFLSGCSSSSLGSSGSSSRKAKGSAPIVAAVVEPSRSTQADGGVRVVKLSGMDLSEAVGVAISRHPDINRADANVARSNAEIAIAKSAWYPTLEYGVRPEWGENTNGRSSNGGVSGTVGLNQLVYDFGRTNSRISAADATLNQQKHLRDNTIEVVALNAADVFVDIAVWQGVMAGAARQVQELKATREKISTRVDAGLSDASDLNQADVAIQRAEADAVKARTGFDVAAGKLAELTGVRPKAVASLSATASMVARLKGGALDVDQTPAILAAKSALVAAQAKVKLAKADRFPSISVGVSQTEMTNRGDSGSGTKFGVNLGGSFSLGGQSKYQIKAAEEEYIAAGQVVENEKLVTRTALSSAETEAAGAAARLSSYEQVIELTKSLRDLYWQEYTLDKRPLTDVINADRDIYASEVEKLNALGDSVKAKIRAYSAVGRLVQALREREGARS